MYGFQTGEKPKTKGAQKGGKIRGPGTGTSDDVKAIVPEGSYIMPADSTEAIGPEALASMGKPVPVNLSNGEYQMPPEQVHAIGAQVLDQMKDATHEPVGPRGFNAQDGELYFADGGKVESTDDLIARISAKYGTSTSAAPRPSPAPAAKRPVPSTPAAPSIGSAANALRNRRSQIDAAAGYADGGVVEDEERKQTQQGTGPSPQMGAVALGNARRVERMGGQGLYEQAGNDLVSQAFPNTVTAIRGAGQNIAEANEKGGIPAAIGATVRNTMVPAIGFAADVGRGVMQILDPAANALKTAVTGDPTPIKGTQPAVKPAAAATVPPRQNAPRQRRGAPEPAAQGFDPSALSAQQRSDAGDAYREAWQRMTPARTDPDGNPIAGTGGMQRADDQAIGFYNAEQQVRGTNITARRGANGVMEFSGNGEGALPQNYSQGFDLAAGNERMARANAARQSTLAPGGQSPGGGVIGGASSREREKLLEIATTPYRGAQNGQITANQLRTLAGLVDGDQRAATEAANQQAATERTAMQEEGANARSQSRDDIDRRRLQSDEQVRGFEVRGLERVENLYQQLENAKTPEERASITEKLRALSGKEAPNRYTVVPGGQEIDPVTNMAVTRPARVFNNQTGQFVEQQGGQQQIQSVPPKDQLRVWQVYQTARGPARWDGKQFVVTGQ